MRNCQNSFRVPLPVTLEPRFFVDPEQTLAMNRNTLCRVLFEGNNFNPVYVKYAAYD